MIDKNTTFKCTCGKMKRLGFMIWMCDIHGHISLYEKEVKQEESCNTSFCENHRFNLIP
jgi:hypothetical protein